MSINLFRWLMFNVVALTCITLAAIYMAPTSEPTLLGPSTQVSEPKQPPQLVLFLLCDEIKGAIVTGYPLTWTDDQTPKTPEFKALALQAAAAGDVYKFKAGSDEICNAASPNWGPDYQASL